MDTIFFGASSTTEEREAFIRNSALLGELVVSKIPLIRLALKHGIPREVLLRDLHNHIGLCVTALAIDIETTKLVGEPAVSLQPPKKPARKRERYQHPPQPTKA